jgi:hypothetical protein
MAPRDQPGLVPAIALHLEHKCVGSACLPAGNSHSLHTPYSRMDATSSSIACCHLAASGQESASAPCGDWTKDWDGRGECRRLGPSGRRACDRHATRRCRTLPMRHTQLLPEHMLSPRSEAHRHTSQFQRRAKKLKHGGRKVKQGSQKSAFSA